MTTIPAAIPRFHRLFREAAGIVRNPQAAQWKRAFALFDLLV
jgi:hypothetical protein